MGDPVVMAWSGGKDSALALAALQADPAWQVIGLLTTITTQYDRISIHGVRRSVLAAQVDALGLPLFEARIGPDSTNAAYEESFAAALSEVRAAHPGVRHIAFGDLFLADVRSYRETLLATLGWAGVFPLWLRDTAEASQSFVAAGFRAVLCCVDTTQLGPEFAGRQYDRKLLADLPAGVDPCGERGEFHTCVYDGPIFRRPVRLRAGEQVLRDQRFQYCDLSLEP